MSILPAVVAETQPRHIALPDGDYSYTDASGIDSRFEFRQLTAADLGDLLDLQDTVKASLFDDGWLRTNAPEMFLDCLTNQVVLGAIRCGRLVGAGVLVDAGESKENIQRYLTENPDLICSSSNLKLILVAPNSRGLGVAKLVVELLGREASSRGQRRILCTIHPENRPSQNLFSGLGYERRKTVATSYGARDVYELELI